MNHIFQLVKDKDPSQREFHQAVTEVVETIGPVMDQNPEYRSAKVLERLVEPERVIHFRVPWMDDYEEYPPDLYRCRLPIRYAWKLRGRRQYRRFRKGCGRNDRSRRSIEDNCYNMC